MLRVLGRKTSSNVQKVLWCLTEMEIPFAREDYGGEFGGNQTPEFLALNPNGVVPTLIDDSDIVWESNTILRYLANRYGPTPLYPCDPSARAACERWMDWQLSTLNAMITPLFVTLVRTPRESRRLDQLEELITRGTKMFKLLNDALSGRAYLTGDELTLADIALGMFAYRWFNLVPEREIATPHLENWFKRLELRPGYREHIMIGLV